MRIRVQVVACGAPISLVDAPPRGNSLGTVVGGENHTVKNRGLLSTSRKKRRRLLKAASERDGKRAATEHPAAPQFRQAGPSTEHMDLGEGWKHVFLGRRVVKATAPPQNPTTSPQPITEAHKQPKVTATRRTARLTKPEPKSTAGRKPATVKPKKTAAASVTTAAAKHTTTNLVVPKKPPTSSLEEITDLLDYLPSKHVWS